LGGIDQRKEGKEEGVSPEGALRIVEVKLEYPLLLNRVCGGRRERRGRKGRRES
jgi:hypothetical protein